MQRVSLARTSEVKDIVSRIGARRGCDRSHGIEQSDVYVLLKTAGVAKRNDQGKSSRRKPLPVWRRVPEVATAISQPIQMRSTS